MIDYLFVNLRTFCCILLIVGLVLGIWHSSASAVVMDEEQARLQAAGAASSFTWFFFGVTTFFALLMITFGIFRKRLWFVIYAACLFLFGTVIIINDSTHWLVFYEAQGVHVQEGAATWPLYNLLCLHIAAIISGCVVLYIQIWQIQNAKNANQRLFDTLTSGQHADQQHPPE